MKALNSTETKIIARYSETDQMGIIYHANYFIWFDVARTDYLKKQGVNYRQMEENGILLPVIEANCKYKVSVKYDDEIIVKTRISELSRTRIKFYYKIYREDIFIAEGFTEHVFLSKEKNKVVNLKKERKDLFEKLFNIYNS